MSVNGATPVGEVEEPPISDNGIDYGTYATSTEKENDSSEDINFSSEDISKRTRTRFFTRVKGEEKRIKNEERKRLKDERKLRDRMLKEAEAPNKAVDNKNTQEAEALRETKQAHSSYRLKKAASFVRSKLHIIITAIVVIAIAVAAIIFVPIIINNIENEQKKETIASGMTDTLKIFSELVDNEYPIESFESVVKAISEKVEFRYYEGINYIYSEDQTEYIEFMAIEKEDGRVYSNFVYNTYRGTRQIILNKTGSQYLYNCDDNIKQFDNVSDAIGEYILEDSKNEQ